MFESMADRDLVDVVREVRRQRSVLMAAELSAVAQLLGRRIAEELAADADAKSMITGFARTAAEVSAAMNLTPGGARQLVAQAEVLDCRLPAVGALLAAGHVDWRTVELIISRTELVEDGLVAQVDAALADRIAYWHCWSRRRIINAIDREVKTVDAEAAKQRRVTAYDDRRVSVSIGADGMARIRATVPATCAVAFDTKLSRTARGVCPKDSRTFEQCRADAMMAMDHGVLACDCDDPECPVRADGASGLAPATVINVVAGTATVSGNSDAPGYLAGFGVIDAEMVRELARDATQRLIEEPVINAADARRYRPSVALARWIRCRDLTCRYPGCDVPAERCDIDHTEPFNRADPSAGGLTVPWNLACYCREHHRIKTLHSGPDGWSDEQLADGTIVWTMPTGHVYRTTPGGVDLFGEMRRRRPEDAKRVTEARERLRKHRPDNEYHRYRNTAAREEIYFRGWRNRTRVRRMAFHGLPSENPSTAPFCTWVNDPLEPETLPPGWHPPPLPRSDPDEPPPF